MTFSGYSVGVVVPAHDEAEFVGGVVAAVPAFVDRVYVVDDASGDDTGAAALAAVDGDEDGAENDGEDGDSDPRAAADCENDGGGLLEPGADTEVDDDTAAGAARALDGRTVESVDRGRLRLLRHARNRGAGGAVATGYLAALADRVDLVATVDADGQMDPADLPRVLAPLADGRAAYATGTRLASPEDRAAFPPMRLAGNVFLTGLARLATGYRGLSDPVNGYTAITGRALAAVDPETLYEGYGYGIDVLGRLRAVGARVVDVPQPSTYGDESSGIALSTYVPRVSRLLAGTLSRRLRREYRGRVGGVAGESVVGGVDAVSEGGEER